MGDLLPQQIAANLPEEQLDYLLWCCLPSTDRQPVTESAYAAEKGMARSTLWRWKANPAFADAVLTLKWSLVKSSDVARIFDAQVRKALKGDMAAADWVMRHLGLSVPEAAQGDQGAATFGASAQASVLQVYVDGRQVDDENARRAAGRAFMGRFRVLPETAEAANG